MLTVDTTNMCSHLQKKLFEEEGVYHSLWQAMQADPELTAVVTGLKRHDKENVISYTMSRVEGENVGSYTITPAGSAEQGNYDVVYDTADLTITKAAVTVTADAKTKVYGDEDPGLTATVV